MPVSLFACLSRAAVAGLGVLASLYAASACSSVSAVKAASGERIELVAIEETFPLSQEVKETRFEGKRLEKAVTLMDGRGLVGAKGSFESKTTVNGGTVTLVVKPADGAERRIVVKNCAEPRVCGFLDDAVAHGLVAHRSVVCKTETPCESK